MNSYSTLLLFIVLAILQTQTGYMLSDPILRGTSVPSVRTKLRRKEKKATEIFVIYYYIPHSRQNKKVMTGYRAYLLIAAFCNISTATKANIVTK